MVVQSCDQLKITYLHTLNRLILLTVKYTSIRIFKNGGRGKCSGTIQKLPYHCVLSQYKGQRQRKNSLQLPPSIGQKLPLVLSEGEKADTEPKISQAML